MMSHEKLIKALKKKEAAALQMGGKAKLLDRKKRGLLNARERIEALLDPNSFREIGLLARSLKLEDRDNTPADGKITGFGTINQRAVAIVANDLTVKGASSSSINSQKIAFMKEKATRSGKPIVFLGESSGARIPDSLGSEAMAQAGLDPQQYCRRRETPWATAVLGPCFGSSTWYACLSDFVVMRKGAVLAVSSARVTSLAIGEEVDPETLGGWRLHSEITGIADAIAETDAEALNKIKQFLAYLPSHANETPPAHFETVKPPNVKDLLTLVPSERNKVYDIRDVISAVVDQDSFFPLKQRFGKSAVTGLARLNGQSIGVVASNPSVNGGALDPSACRKVTSFLALCDSFHIPIILLVDTPGFLVGVEGERRAAPAQIMNMMHALQLCTVPKIAIILRKSYGQAFLNFGGGRNSDEVAAWPSADISFMDPNIGVNVVFGINRNDDPMQFDAACAAFTRSTSAYDMAGVFGVQTIIDPRETRRYLIETLSTHRSASTGGLGKREMANWPTYF